MPHRSVRTHGFTLVELLVVIGIIALLVGLLLPALGKARQQAQSALCLANLRSIGQAFNLYINDSRGYIVPGSVQRLQNGSIPAVRGEDSWATILVTRGYIKHADQGALMGADMAGTAWDNPTSVGNTVFRCPSGSDTANNPGPGTGSATSKSDGPNQGYWRRQSWTNTSGTTAQQQSQGAIVDTWYAGNFIQPGYAAESSDTSTAQALWPMRTLGRDFTTGVMHGGLLTKLTQFRHPSELALLFDGAKCHNLFSNNISLRHANRSRCNFLFADFHCEAVRGDQLPNGSDTPTSPSGTADFDSIAPNATHTLANHPFPKWRLDQ